MRKLLSTISIFFVLAFSAPLVPIPLDNFDDAIGHWQMGHREPYPRYNLDQIREIGDNILLLQHNDGGWIQNLDPARILSAEEKAKYLAEKSSIAASFDNRNMFSQIEYLMNVYSQTRDDKYRQSAIRGLEYVISQQIAGCGGWPHSIPATQDYHAKLTVADEVFSGNLRLLRNISYRKAPYQSFDRDIRRKAAQALARGDECLLRLQVHQNGVLTGWAGQYDRATFAPSIGRKFELPAIVSQESVEVLRYLMSIERPSSVQIAAIEGGIAWLKKSAIKGVRYETFDTGETTQFTYHATREDRRIVSDENAPLLWARFYDLNDNSIVMATRESVRVYNYIDIPRERRTGYSWYGYWPARLLEVEYPVWKRRFAIK